MHKIHIFALTSLFFLTLARPLPAFAETDAVTENLKKRLQETVASSPAPSSSPSYRSLVGVIRDVIKDTLIMEDKDGEKSIRLASGSALVRSPGNATIKTEDIRLEDYAIAIGHFIAEDELESVRLIVSTEPLNNVSKVSGLATITKLGKNTLSLTPSGGGEVKNLTVSTKTIIKSPLGDSLEFSSLAVGDSILYTGSLSKDVIEATNLMRIGFASDASPSPSN